MRDLFACDARRHERFSIAYRGLLLDYSKNRISDEALALLFELAREAQLEKWRERLFRGEAVNTGEHKAALHLVLRDDGHGPAAAAGKTDEVVADKARMYALCEDIRAGRLTGYGGQPLRNIVNIGIGGSYLGSATTCHALAHLAADDLRVFFITNVDARQMSQTLAELDPEHTLFVVTSKTFTTQETLVNARRAKEWITGHCAADEAWHQHFFAITARVEEALRFGLPTDRILPLWDSVGGRFSLWSCANFALAVLIGSREFEQLLAGARSMDAHFFSAPLTENMPVILGLLGIWYVNFFNAGSHVVLPYDHALERLPAYLQQLEMESNGKSVSRDGRRLPYATAPVVWGGSGLEGQHAYYQLLHQGERLVPADFIITANSTQELRPNDDILRANFLAQTHALMHGDECADNDMRRHSSGNQPSNALVLDTLSPFILGLLLALYEHKVFVQATIWGINPFDQWGVEFGKRLSVALLSGNSGELDASTRALMTRLMR